MPETLKESDLLKKQKALETAEYVTFGVSEFDAANRTAIFSLYTAEGLAEALASTARFVLFPSVIASSITSAILSWRETQLEGWKKSNVTKSIINTATAVTITIVITGGLVGAAAFTGVGGPTFVAISGFKALQAGGTSIYHLVRSFKETNPEKKHLEQKNALTNAIGATAFAIGSAGTACVFIFAEPALAPLGIAAAVINGGYTTYKIIDVIQRHRKKEKKLMAASTSEDAHKAQEIHKNSFLSSTAKALRSLLHLREVHEKEPPIEVLPLMQAEGTVVVPLAELNMIITTPEPPAINPNATVTQEAPLPAPQADIQEKQPNDTIELDPEDEPDPLLAMGAFP